MSILFGSVEGAMYLTDELARNVFVTRLSACGQKISTIFIITLLPWCALGWDCVYTVRDSLTDHLTKLCYRNGLALPRNRFRNGTRFLREMEPRVIYFNEALASSALPQRLELPFGIVAGDSQSHQ